MLRAVDLDLDVVRGNTGRVWVDDEDEFAEHRVAFDYPEDVVTSAVASAERRHSSAVRVPVAAALSTVRPHRAWLDRGSRAAAGRPGGDRTAGSRGGTPRA